MILAMYISITNKNIQSFNSDNANYVLDTYLLLQCCCKGGAIIIQYQVKTKAQEDYKQCGL